MGGESHYLTQLYRAANSFPAKGFLSGLFACYAINKASSLLSHCVLNNWHPAEPWNSQQELVLITGGSSGIGQTIAEELSEREVKVVIIDIQEPEFTHSPNIYFYEADVTSTDSIKAAADKIRAKHGHPTVLVNNAGVFTNDTILDEPESMIWKSFKVNTLAHFLTVKEFLPSMVRHNHGHVVTMASMASFITVGEMVDYACTKASALAFHEGLSQEIRHWYGATRVRTSIVNPLWVRTPLIRNLTDAGDSFGQPIMDTRMVSAAVVKHILERKSGSIILPASSSVATFIRSLPSWLQEWLRNSFSLKVMRVRNEFWSREPSL
ncbi:SDR family oxidoreductase [Aspergillus ruber CBS 135680]|uniref:Short-chain dehydrogenase/reductase 3 n=1 Tax=Aspergillus ruber (strain CBS 135680) TaxID=1388766 RepID=A0A017SHP5_ASPRC|nr:putative short-chain dehydrogenase/reductase 2 [Aspergillus ruber CBS 135680]EYE96281.1 putative short-chain dehydrogenase/reductase 2 [Aspergillus ruber CBS 135680]